MRTFKEIIFNMKNLEVEKQNDLGYTKRLKKSLETQKTLLKSMEKMYGMGSIYSQALEAFLENVSQRVSSGEELVCCGESMVERIKYYLQIYITIPSYIDDEDVVLVKKLSTELLGDFDSFLFIIKLIDNDLIFKSSLHIMLNIFNTKLTEHKFLTVPFVTKK